MMELNHVLSNFHYKVERALVTVKRYFQTRFGHAKSNYGEITKYSGISFAFGKKEIVELIEKLVPNRDCKILDVGPGRGIYNILLKEKGYKNFDAIEIYLPYIEKFQLRKMYSNVFHRDVGDFNYEYYDIIIMGDVVEHLNVKKAQRVVRYAQKHSKLVVIAVPYNLKQIGTQLDGSGDHRQPDLTRDLFCVRYPGFNLLIDDQKVGVFYFRANT